MPKALSSNLPNSHFTIYFNEVMIITRARILMQKHIFSMWAESKDALKSEEFSMKGVFMQKL